MKPRTMPILRVRSLAHLASALALTCSLAHGQAANRGALFEPLKPLIDYPVRDTCICLAEGTYYLTGTTGSPDWWRTNDGIRLWKSGDLRHWEELGMVWSFAKDVTWQAEFKEVNGGPSRAIWAPEIHYIKSNFYIAYCVSYGGTGILRSTTGKPAGPYRDVRPAGPLTPEIDASLFVDDDEAVYLVFQNGKIARLKDDLSDLAEAPRLIVPANHKQVGFEGAFIFKTNGRYYLSCAELNDSGYHCMIATAPKLSGPWSNRYLAIPDAGHNTFFRDKSGQWFSTIFGHSDHAVFREKPGILPVQFDRNGRVYPAMHMLQNEAR